MTTEETQRPFGYYFELDIDLLAKTLSGSLYRPGDPGYERELETYNSLQPLRPPVVVAAASVEDVQAAVRFAARQSLPVTVLGGGHLMTGPIGQALVITLHRMAQVSVDAQARTAG